MSRPTPLRTVAELAGGERAPARSGHRVRRSIPTASRPSSPPRRRRVMNFVSKSAPISITPARAPQQRDDANNWFNNRAGIARPTTSRTILAAAGGPCHLKLCAKDRPHLRGRRGFRNRGGHGFQPRADQRNVLAILQLGIPAMCVPIMTHYADAQCRRLRHAGVLSE